MSDKTFENKNNKDFRNNNDKISSKSESAKKGLGTDSYQMNYDNLEDCIKQFDKLLLECRDERRKIKKPTSSKCGKGDVTNSIRNLIKEHDKVWDNVLKLIKSTKETVLTFENVSKNADQG
ncbi:MAG: hypothetical protein MR398_07420 [Oscillospiraceae bacterium]|nr:hypothetical protein [Oscillospiraceae bacterium]